MRGLLLVLALNTGPAVELAWTGDPACDEQAFRASLDVLLAGVAPADALAVTVAATRARGRWTLQLTLDEPGGRSTRRLHGPTCAAVSEAAAFVTAMVVDPSLADRTVAPAAVDEPAPDDTDRPTPDIPPPPEPSVPVAPPIIEPVSPPVTPELPPPAAATPPPRSGPQGFVRLAGGFEALGMPAIGGQLHAAAGALGRRWRVEVRGAYRLPRRLAPPGDASATTRIGLWTLGAHGCGVLRPSVLEIPLCACLEAGQAFGSADGIPNPRSDRIPWLAATVGAAIAWAPRRWLALWLGLDLAVPLLRGGFRIAGLGEVHTIAPVAPRGALGLELRFP